MDKKSEEIYWTWISQNEKLSEYFIEKNQDKVNWACISGYQKLSERFIKKFQDKVEWGFICWYQNLSESFIKKFQDKINWYCLIKFNMKIPIRKIKKDNIKCYKIYNHIYVYKDTEKNKRYLFLKNADYIKDQNFLIVFN